MIILIKRDRNRFDITIRIIDRRTDEPVNAIKLINVNAEDAATYLQQQGISTFEIAATLNAIKHTNEGMAYFIEKHLAYINDNLRDSA